MKTKIKNSITIFLAVFYLISIVSFASAVIVDAEFVTLYPGEEKEVRLNVENNFDYDIGDVRVSVLLSEIPFTSIGSSTKTEDEIKDDKDESFVFRIRPATDIQPGDYSIPYEVKYLNDENNETVERGSFGIRVSARTDLDFAIEGENNIKGRQGSIDFEIINKGLGEIKSVTVEVSPQGYELLSANRVFVGNIDAEDSDIVTFDVLFEALNPSLVATVKYKDFDNNDQTETVSLPIKVYSEEEALRIGLITQSNTSIYILIVAILVILWIVWRVLRKRKKRRV